MGESFVGLIQWMEADLADGFLSQMFMPLLGLALAAALLGRIWTRRGPKDGRLARQRIVAAVSGALALTGALGGMFHGVEFFAFGLVWGIVLYFQVLLLKVCPNCGVEVNGLQRRVKYCAECGAALMQSREDERARQIGRTGTPTG